jgi:uncharacterized cofD-like protein
VAAVGGGHGLAASLHAVRRYAGDVTAIVAVADDGGSSGRLRESIALPPPGDLRKCLAALAADDSLLARALDHRFDAGELEGHALGNLLITGLADAGDDFQAALDEVGRLLGAVGRVLPATTEPVVLKAEAGGDEVAGQVAVSNAVGITRVSLTPPDPPVAPGVVEAIEGADQIVIGPGSLYTSVLAAAAVPGVRTALARTPARKVYVCNLAPEVPETAGYGVADHVGALRAHGLEVDVVVCHEGGLSTHGLDVAAVVRPIARPGGLAHDPALLADVLAELV